jgi:hypothetical protein
LAYWLGMSLTLEIILQARLETVRPDAMEVDLPGEALATARAEASNLHISEEVLVIALLNICDTVSLEPHLGAAELPVVDSISLPSKSAQIARREASKRKASPGELVHALLEMWKSQPVEVRQALADDIQKTKEAEVAGEAEYGTKDE